MTELAQVRGMLEMVLTQLHELREAVEPKHGAITISAFAKHAGYSRWTIAKKIKDGEIRTQADGRIPYKELRRFLS